MQSAQTYPQSNTAAPAARRWTIRRVLRALFLAWVNVYAFVALAYFGLRWFIGEQSINGTGSYPLRLLGSFVGSANSFMPAWLLPLVVLGVIALLLRGWATVVLTLPTVLVLIWQYGNLFLPTEPPGNIVGSPFSVVTYNLHGDPRDSVIARQAANIRLLDADLVLIQELSEEAAAVLDRELSAEYPYRALFPYPGERISGGGIFSRYPLENASTWRNTMGHTRAEALIDGVRVQVFSVHPMVPSLTPWAYSSLTRDGEIADILGRANGVDPALPFILAGDFNLNDQSPMYRTITGQGFGDSVREAGYSFNPTFPNLSAAFSWMPSFLNFPLARIDYIFHNFRLQTIEARTHYDSGGSDHFPVYARLVLVDPTLSMD